LADLGLERVLDDPELNRLTASGVVVGTPYYIAPEAIRDPRSAGPAADLYSLGATLFHCLTGQPPFEGSSPYSLLRAHLEDAPPALATLRPGVPAVLRDAIAACLAKDPSARPTATGLVDDLRQGRAPLMEALRSRRRRLLLIAVLIAACLSIVTWRLAARAVSGDGASLTITASRNDWQLRLDGGAWLEPGTVPQLPPGRRRLEARVWADGRLLAWHGEVDAIASGQVAVTLDLQAQRSLARLDALPGGGVVLLQGRAVAAPPLRLPFVGNYRILRWDGASVLESVVQVDATSATASTWERRPWPSDAAFFSRADGDGQATPPLHVVAAGEVTAVFGRDGVELPPTITALVAAGSAAAPAGNLDAAAVGNWERLTTAAGWRLPEAAEADALAARLGSPVWHRRDGRLYHLGRSGAAVLLVTLPK
jgi:hypothetical protein